MAIKPVSNEMLSCIKILLAYDMEFHLSNFTLCDEPTLQVIVTYNGKRIGDAVCHSFSYGGPLGLLEVMLEPTPDDDPEEDGVLGWLTGKDAADLLYQRYQYAREEERC